MTAGHSAHRQKGAIYRLQPSVERIVEAVLVILNEAVRRNVSVTQYDIVKTLFLADKAHLNNWGRPITFDNYVAMQHGPVPSLTYDILKENRQVLSKYNITLEWQRHPAGGTRYIYTSPHRQADEDILSTSDIEMLKIAFGIISSLNFHQIRRLTHEDLAYVEAWQDDEGRKQYPMSLELFFDIPNAEAARDLEFLSKHR